MTTIEGPIPSFARTTLDQIVNGAVFFLVAETKNTVKFVGTAVNIGAGVALSARHIIDECHKIFGESNIISSDGTFEGTFSLYAINLLNKKHYIVKHVSIPLNTDLVVLQFPIDPTEDQLLLPKISLLPPPIGSIIQTFGYSGSASLSEEGHIQLYPEGYTARGYVKNVHRTRRDSVTVNFPSFHCNARYIDGMSGGAVFNEDGHLCGIVCTGFELTEEEKEEISYATLLYPMVGLSVVESYSEQGHETISMYQYLTEFRKDVVGIEGIEYIPGEPVRLRFSAGGRPPSDFGEE